MKSMTRLTLLTLCFCTTIALSAQSEQTRSVAAFDEIAVESGIDLYLTQDEDQEVRIVADEDFIDKVVTEVVGSKLKIYLKKGSKGWSSWNSKKLEAHVSVAYLRRIMASGGSDVESTGVWKSDDFSIQSSGGSDVELAVEVSEMEIQCSGGSDVNLEGTVDKINIQSSGGSDFNGKKLITKIARIQCSGGSDVYIHVTDELIANASGASDIHYAGNPRKRDINASSSSDVEPY